MFHKFIYEFGCTKVPDEGALTHTACCSHLLAPCAASLRWA